MHSKRDSALAEYIKENVRKNNTSILLHAPKVYIMLTRIRPQAPMGFQCLAGSTLAPNRLPLEPVSDSKGA